LGRHIPADPDQRFGALLLVLAAWAAVARRREPPVRFCLAVLLTQVPVWLFATHLYARFAVPLLIPLILLVGRVPLAAVGERRIVVGLVVVGSLMNLAFAARLYTGHMVLQGQRFALEGAADFFTRGLGLGHEHLEIVNGDLPADARILMLGDAKAFYFRRSVDYCVVFNRNPFAAQVRGGADPPALLNWLTDRGYTHVLVNWSEIRRLADSAYGFDPNINPELFERLVAAGLQPGQPITPRATDRMYAQLYRLPTARR
jgi:hypothetical protein